MGSKQLMRLFADITLAKRKCDHIYYSLREFSSPTHVPRV